MSLVAVLGEYLAAMKERGELDVLVPELLGAMGHTVLTRPQRGTRQAGVDCLSEVRGEAGLEVFLFILKCGDVDRAEFYASPQGIEPSIREARSDYIRNRLPAHLADARKHIVLLTNGGMKEQVQQGFASLTKDVAESGVADLEFWGQVKLVTLIEKHLLEEALILGEGRSHLRRAIATIERSEVAVGHISAFFTAALPHDATTAKDFDKRFTAAITGWLVFRAWCRTENNLRPIAIAGEMLLLSSWASAQRSGLNTRREFLEKHDQLGVLHAELLVEYFDKILEQLLHPRALFRYRPMRLLFLNQISDDLGRLATLALFLLEAGSPAAENVIRNLAALIETHQGVLLPYFDGQSVDISLALAAFIRGAIVQPATEGTKACIGRLEWALRREQFLPVDSDSFDDALAVELDDIEKDRQCFQISSYVPMLATVAAELGSEEALEQIRTSLVPRMSGVTLERWFPTVRLETSWGSPVMKGQIGASRAVAINASCDEERAAAIDLPEGAEAPEAFQTCRAGRTWLLAMSARLFRHPLPPWYFGLMRTPGQKQSRQTA